MKIYEHYRDLFLRANSEQFNEYKEGLDNNGKYLVDLLLGIRAYDCGFTMQIWHDYQYKNLEIRNTGEIKGYVEAQEDYYDQDKVKEVEACVDSYFKSSFDNKWSKKIKNIMLGRELMDIKPTDSMTAESLTDDLNKNWLPLYKTERSQVAIEIKRRYKLSAGSQIIHQVFDEIIYLSNEGNKTEYAKEIVTFFERGIEKILPMFMNDLGETQENLSLINLRRPVKTRFNTLCWRCGKPLIKKKNDKHYCTRFENRKCYIERCKEVRDSGLPQVIGRTKNKCDRCGKASPLNYIHKLNGQDMQFCSNRCWESYRKAKHRQKGHKPPLLNNLSQKTVAI